MQAEIYSNFAHLNSTDAGREAVAEYLEALEGGKTETEAGIIGSNVLQRSGFNVNAKGGASFRVASIDHNEIRGERVSLTIDCDDKGFFVATADGEDTEARFATATAAYNSISTRWGNGWGLQLAGQA